MRCVSSGGWRLDVGCWPPESTASSIQDVDKGLWLPGSTSFRFINPARPFRIDTMDPQPQCGLFRLPFEIREAILLHLSSSPLEIHLSRQKQQIVLSRCKTPSPSHKDDGSERCPYQKPEWFYLRGFPKNEAFKINMGTTLGLRRTSRSRRQWHHAASLCLQKTVGNFSIPLNWKTITD